MDDSLSARGGWNYWKVKIGDRFYVCEVYYDEEDRPIAYAGGPPDGDEDGEWLPSGDSEAELLTEVEENLKDAQNMMGGVMRGPLLDVSEIGASSKDES